MAFGLLVFVGCYSPDPGIVNVDPPAQQAQAGGSGPCVGACAPTYVGTFVTDGSPAWLDGEGITLIVPGVRCIDAAAYPAWVPVGTTCSNVWAGFQTGAPPQLNVSTPGNWAARMHLQGGAIPLNAPSIYLWLSEEIFASGTLTSFRWRYLEVKRRAEGVLFRVVTYGAPAEALPRPRTNGTCTELFTYFASSGSNGGYSSLISGGYDLDILAVAAFRPAMTLDQERRVGRQQALPSGLIPIGTYPVPFSPQRTYSRTDGCWFAVNYSDEATGIFPISLATADEYLRNGFGILRGP